MQTPAFASTKTLRTVKLLRALIWVVAVVAMYLCPACAFGQTNSSWIGGNSNWSNATYWTPNQVPNNGGGNTYNVTIHDNSNVTLDQNVTISSLTLADATGTPSTLAEDLGSPYSLSVTGNAVINAPGYLQVTTLSG